MTRRVPWSTSSMPIDKVYDHEAVPVEMRQVPRGAVRPQSWRPTMRSWREHDGRRTLSRLRPRGLPVRALRRGHSRRRGGRAAERCTSSATGLLRPSEIRSKREALGFKQKELAGYLRINESTLSRWETGRPDPAKVNGCVSESLLRARRNAADAGCARRSRRAGGGNGAVRNSNSRPRVLRRPDSRAKSTC